MSAHYKTNARTAQSGFTLVELSIVLVIIGFLIAGIAAANQMVNAARLQRIEAQTKEFIFASTAFFDKYNYMLGDFPNAYAHWGTQGNCTDADVNSDVNGCNGNGDNSINPPSGGQPYYETLRFWQHLSLSGFYPGNFTGVGSTQYSITDAGHNAGENVPAGPYTNSGYWVRNLRLAPPNDNGSYTFFILARHEFQPGFPWYDTSFFTAIDMSLLDKKYDDGLPLSGNIRAKTAFAPYVTNVYDLSSTDLVSPAYLLALRSSSN